MKFTSQTRKSLPKKDFGLPNKAPGSGSYPMPPGDKGHARSAKSFASRFASPSQRKAIDAKANKILGSGHRGPVHTKSSQANGGT